MSDEQEVVANDAHEETVDTNDAPETGPHIVSWKGVDYDLRGYDDFRFFMREKDNQVHAYLYAEGQLDPTAKVDVGSVSEAQELRALCGPYFGHRHLV